jgi:hypothetical protein
VLTVCEDMGAALLVGRKLHPAENSRPYFPVVESIGVGEIVHLQGSRICRHEELIRLVLKTIWQIQNSWSILWANLQGVELLQVNSKYLSMVHTAGSKLSEVSWENSMN